MKTILPENSGEVVDTSESRRGLKRRRRSSDDGNDDESSDDESSDGESSDDESSDGDDDESSDDESSDDESSDDSEDEIPYVRPNVQNPAEAVRRGSRRLRLSTRLDPEELQRSEHGRAVLRNIRSRNNG
jgi:hypothetical protein